MSPHPLDNPFRKRTPPTKSEAGVIGSLLGDAAQTAFEAVGGSDTIGNDDEYFLDEGSEETGKKLKQETENALERNGKWTRKRYILWAESFGKDKDWVDEHFIFQKDGTTITPGDIILFDKGLTELPRGWIEVEGNCDLGGNRLTSLIGAPESVGGSFWCNHNQLTSLVGAPKSVRGDFWCGENQLTSLNGAPRRMRGGFWCNDNLLISLTGSPEIVGGGFSCENNQLATLTGAPANVGGNFWCNNNRLTSLEKLPENIFGKINARNNPLTTEAITQAKAKWSNQLLLV